MRTYVPDYYGAFQCLAGACRHSCCVGWEIGIDPATASYFAAIPGAFGEKIRANCETESGSCRFRMGDDGRCPFLQTDGLCEIICRLGTDSLPDVCDDHPRYRNYFCGRVEMGLGLCCEAAARLILTREKPVRWVPLHRRFSLPRLPDAFERRRFAARKIAQDRKIPIADRVTKLFSFCKQNFAYYADFLLSLEILNDEWRTLLCDFRAAPIAETALSFLPVRGISDVPYEQLLVCFLDRHYPQARKDSAVRDAEKKAVAFSVFSVLFLSALTAWRGGGIDTLCDLSRLYSAEVEYAEENTEKLKTFLISHSEVAYV